MAFRPPPTRTGRASSSTFLAWSVRVKMCRANSDAIIPSPTTSTTAPTARRMARPPVSAGSAPRGEAHRQVLDAVDEARQQAGGLAARLHVGDAPEQLT